MLQLPLGKEPIILGTGMGQDWGCLFLASVPLFLSLLCVSSQGIPDPLPARREKSVQGIHRLESLRSKSYLISLLTRFQGCDWHGARVAEAFKCTAGRPSSIKTNQWLIQPCSRPCWDERGREAKGQKKRGRERMCVWGICHL